MINIPAFKAHLHVEVILGEGVLILSEEAANALHGGAYEKIAPLIDGQRSTDEIVDALANQMDAATAYYALDRMEAKGFLTEATPHIPSDVAAFWHGIGIEPGAALAALRGKRVWVKTIGEFEPTAMLSALDLMTITISGREQADFWLVLTNDYLNVNLTEINSAALKANRTWMLVRVTGQELWLGPLFQPGETACWVCLKRRLERNRAVHRFVAEKKNLVTPPSTAQGVLPATQAVACQMAAFAVAQFLAGAASGLAGKVLSLNWRTHTPQTHALVRHPHCPACGTAENHVLRPIQLRPAKVAFVRDGGHRSVSPEITLKRYEHLVSPITGVVRMLTPVLQDDGIAHVYLAGHNPGMKMNTLDYFKQSLRNNSSGKGMSEMQAKVSALCEAIERYSGEFPAAELVVTASYAEMRARHDDNVIHPNVVMQFSERQFAERERWNAKESKFNGVPEALPDNQPIDWTPAWSISQGCHKYLPTQLLYYGSPASAACNKLYSVGCSNGSASGNTLEEAILQGFFELVERDAVALWWYNRLLKPGVEVETFGEPYLLELAEHYGAHYKRVTWALDITSDLGIPVFVAVSKMVEGNAERLLFGFGCHLDARVALQRAFTEMNQMLGIAHAGEDRELVLEDAETLEWLRNATIANQPYMTAAPGQPLKRFGDYPTQHSGEFLQDINYCRRIIEKQRMEMLILDQTRADVGMPVVKVIVPGLRHFWARYGQGRLYDVPVRMGWLDRPLREDELNPVAVFF